MPVSEIASGDRLILSPQEPLVAGGAAEEFERRVQTLFKRGHRMLVADLRNVPAIDSAGVRALVRGYTTAHRLDASFRVVAPTEHVRGVLRMSNLDKVLRIYDTVQDAQAREWPWATIRIAIGGTLLCLALVVLGLNLTAGTLPGLTADDFPPAAGAPGIETSFRPFFALASLIVAALIGLLVTAVARHTRHERPLTQSMEQAQVLLCVSGAMMMIIIGNSLVRAFGIAGAASIIRFRTPVDDPRDITILFLLMGLGMSAGLGAFAVSGLATLFLCGFLLFLDRYGHDQRRRFVVEVASDAREFPSAHVENVFVANGVSFEPREVSQGKETIIRYQCSLDNRTSLEELSAQLVGEGASGVKSVSWDSKKS
jgi:anti-anti-sigma factor